MAARAARSTPGRVRRAVRRWTDTCEPAFLTGVPGASPVELRQLAVLGGVAAALPGEDVAFWPIEALTWAFGAPKAPKELTSLILDGFQEGFDPLAEAYEACISAPHRRQLGTVFTPAAVVEHMLDLVDGQLNGDPVYVIEPGAGVGAFTLAAARRWPSTHIVAVDVNVVTLGLLAARITYERTVDREFARRTGRIDLRLGDYLDEIANAFTHGEAGPVVALGNPPYTRAQALSAGYKERAARMATSVITSRHANLAVLFQALTFAHMRDQDLCCMVLPGSIAFTRAARDFRRELWKSPRPVTVHRWPATSRAFVGRDVQAAVVMIGAKTDKAGALRLSRVDLDEDEVVELERWDLPRTGDPPDNWYWPSTNAATAAGSTPITELAVVRRGTATGANRFFFLADDVAARFPEDAVTPAIPSLRRFHGDELTSETHASWGGQAERRWLLTIAPDAGLTPELQAYINEHKHYARGYLCSQRVVWWAITELPRPDILVSPLAKLTFKVVLNTIKAVPSNNLLGLTVHSADAASLARWLRSNAGQTELQRVSRRYHGGSHKLEPGDLRRLRVPSAVGGLR